MNTDLLFSFETIDTKRDVLKIDKCYLLSNTNEVWKYYDGYGNFGGNMNYFDLMAKMNNISKKDALILQTKGQKEGILYPNIIEHLNTWGGWKNIKAKNIKIEVFGGCIDYIDVNTIDSDFSD